jgi:4'-phosphopantetheinyl transferase
MAMLECFALNLAGPVDEEQEARLLCAASQARRERIARLRLPQDRRRALYAHALVRFLAAGRLGVACEQLAFAENEYGKPFLVGFPSFHFNISHSGDWVVCALGDKEVGVDVEREAPLRSLAIAERFFTPEESRALAALPQEERGARFYELWTLKESYIKYQGKGLAIPLSSFGFVFVDGRARLMRDEGLFFMHERMADGYHRAVCAPAPQGEVPWRELTPAEIHLEPSAPVRAR